MEREGLLPGFVAGYSKIHQDETATSAMASGILRQVVAEDAAMADVVRATLPTCSCGR